MATTLSVDKAFLNYTKKGVLSSLISDFNTLRIIYRIYGSKLYICIYMDKESIIYL